MSTCRTCEEMPICLEGLDRYSLQDDTYYFTLNCPPGYVCTGRDNVYLVCCDGDILHVIFPIGATQADKDLALDGMISECARRSCNGTTPTSFNPNGPGPGYIPWTRDNPTPLYYNEPQSCTAYCPDGTPFTFTVPAGTFIAFDLATANAQAKAYACQQAPLMIICLGGFTACACVGSSFNGSIGITSANPPFSASVVAGTFPPGLHISTGGNSVIISGTPATAGTYNFTIRVSDPHGNSNIRSYSMSVMRITTTTLPNYTVGTAYSLQLTAAGGSGNYAWRIYSGTLPDGLTLSATGLISGTPTGLTSGGTVVFEVIDTACEQATRAFYTPRSLLVPSSTTRLLTKRGWSEYVASTGALYKKVTYTGFITQLANTAGSVFGGAPAFCAGAKYLYSGASEINIYGAFLSHHKKELYVPCPTASWPSIQSLPNFGMSVLLGYCWPADPNTCAVCSQTEADWVLSADYATTSGQDNPFSMVLNNAGYTITPTVLTYNSAQSAFVSIQGVVNFPLYTYGGQYQHWVAVGATGNFSATLSDEYTDADALSAATIFNSNSAMAENKPNLLTWVSNNLTNRQSRTTSVAFNINCLNLVAGQSYTVHYHLLDSDGTTTQQNVVFVATGSSHVIHGTVPTPAANHTITVKDVTISYTP